MIEVGGSQFTQVRRAKARHIKKQIRIARLAKQDYRVYLVTAESTMTNWDQTVGMKWESLDKVKLFLLEKGWVLG